MRNVEQEIAQWKARLQSVEGVCDETLLANARNGCTAAVHQLSHRFESRIAKIIEARLGRAKAGDKEDLFQEAFLQVFNGIRLGKFESDSEASFLRWFVLVVTNVLADWRHREGDNTQGSVSIAIIPCPCDEREKGSGYFLILLKRVA